MGERAGQVTPVWGDGGRRDLWGWRSGRTGWQHSSRMLRRHVLPLPAGNRRGMPCGATALRPGMIESPDRRRQSIRRIVRRPSAGTSRMLAWSRDRQAPPGLDDLGQCVMWGRTAPTYPGAGICRGNSVDGGRLPRGRHYSGIIECHRTHNTSRERLGDAAGA